MNNFLNTFFKMRFFLCVFVCMFVRAPCAHLALRGSEVGIALDGIEVEDSFDLLCEC